MEILAFVLVAEGPLGRSSGELGEHNRRPCGGCWDDRRLAYIIRPTSAAMAERSNGFIWSKTG